MTFLCLTALKNETVATIYSHCSKKQMAVCVKKECWNPEILLLK